MTTGIRRFIQPAALTIGIFGLATLPFAQSREGLLSGNIKYSSGQGVQPIFEGWTKNADGTHELHFGYLNRNHVEEVQVPVGADNTIEPGGPDRGQPTYFYTRFNRQMFSVTVPGDWGMKEVIWTVFVHGRSERAVGWLRPDWEIAAAGTRAGANGKVGEGPTNQPPTLTVSGSPRIAVSETLTLTAKVTDDGLPESRTRGGGDRANRPPAFDNPAFTATTPINVPQVQPPRLPTIADRLQVSWFVWRGPGPVAFDPPVAGADGGEVAVRATFSQPGDYVLRARATDTAARTMQDVKVVVGGP